MDDTAPFTVLRPLARRLPEEVAARMSEAIGAGRFAPGDRLPAEQQLAADFGVSRPVVREAISRLRQEGLVSSQQGRGAFVTEPAQQGIFRISPECFAKRRKLVELLELRTGVEADAVALAARHRTTAELATMQRELARMNAADALGRDGADERVAAENAFYAAVARAAGNEYVTTFLRMISTQVELHLSSVIVKNAIAAECGPAVLEEHEAVLAAIEARDAEAARLAARRHFASAAARLVARADLADV